MKKWKKLLLFVFSLLLLIRASFWIKKQLFSPSIFPNPLSSYEEKNFFLLKELLRSEMKEIKNFKGPRWNEESMGLEVFTSDGTKIIFSPEKDLTEQVTSLQLILKKYRILNNGKEKPKIIDLRTINPYVSF